MELRRENIKLKGELLGFKGPGGAKSSNTLDFETSKSNAKN